MAENADSGMKDVDQDGDPNVYEESDQEELGETNQAVVPVSQEDEDYGEVVDEDGEWAKTTKTRRIKNDPEVIAALTTTLKSYDMIEMKEFLLTPVPQGVWLECHIIRISTGITKFQRKFQMFTDSGVHLCSSAKRPWVKNKTSNYLISSNPNDLKNKGDAYVGKLRSNFLGSEFTAYGEGPNPKNVKNSEDPRPEVGLFQYSSHLMGKKPKGPRKLTVVLPHVKENNEVIICKAVDPAKDGLAALMEHNSQMTASDDHPQLVTTYCSKNARWNEKMKSFVLNFNSRVAEPSVKNFQLIRQDDPEKIVLQFGRVKKNLFNIDFGWPITPLQACSLALSSFDYKICSE